MRILPGDQNRSAHLGDNRAELSPTPLSLRQRVLCFPLLKNVLQWEGGKKQKKLPNLQTRANGGEHVAR